jgi:hypothetical protein
MPTVTETKVDGWVSCIDPRCAGYEQRPVEVIRRVAAFTYRELGGDGAVPQTAIERETVGVVQTDETCGHCGKPVVFSDAPRPEYAPVSGQDPLEILAISQQTQIRDVQKTVLDRDRADLERDREIMEMRAAMNEMKAELQRRKGGRPVKDPEAE